MIITPICKPVPMPDDVIEVMNKMGKDEGMPDGIYFATGIRNQLLMIYMETLNRKMTAVVYPIRVETC